MITQKCDRCHKEETYPTDSNPTLFLNNKELYCKACLGKWETIQANLRDNYNTNVNERRDKFFRLGEET